MLGTPLWPIVNVTSIENFVIKKLKVIEEYEFIKNYGTSTILQYICSQSLRKEKMYDHKRQRVIDFKLLYSLSGAVTLSNKQNSFLITLTHASHAPRRASSAQPFLKWQY